MPQFQRQYLCYGSIARIFRGSLFEGGGNFLGMGMNYLALFCLLRGLPQQAFGVAVVIQSYMLAGVAVCTFGSARLLEFRMPPLLADGQVGEARRLTITSISLSGGICLAFFAILAPIWSRVCHVAFHQVVPLWIYLIVPLACLTDVVVAVYVASLNVAFDAMVRRTMGGALNLAAAFYVWYWRHGLNSYLFLFVCIQLIIAVASIMALFIKSPLRAKGPVAITFRKFHSMRAVLPLGVWGVLQQVWGQVEILVLGAMAKPADAGIFRIYLSLVAIALLIISAPQRTYRPIVAMVTGPWEETAPQHVQLFRRLARYQAVATAFVGIGFISFSEFVIQLMLKGKYDFSMSVYFIVLVFTLLSGFSGPSVAALLGAGRFFSVMALMFVAVMVKGVTAWLLADNMGAMGGAIAYAAGTVVVIVIAYWRLLNLYGRCILEPCIAGIAAIWFVVALLILFVFEAIGTWAYNPFVSTLTMTVGLVLVTALFVGFGLLKPEEIRQGIESFMHFFRPKNKGVLHDRALHSLQHNVLTDENPRV